MCEMTPVVEWYSIRLLINATSVHLHLQDTSKLQCVEDFLEGMLEKRKFE